MLGNQTEKFEALSSFLFRHRTERNVNVDADFEDDEAEESNEEEEVDSEPEPAPLSTQQQDEVAHHKEDEVEEELEKNPPHPNSSLEMSAGEKGKEEDYSNLNYCQATDLLQRHHIFLNKNPSWQEVWKKLCACKKLKEDIHNADLADFDEASNFIRANTTHTPLLVAIHNSLALDDESSAINWPNDRVKAVFQRLAQVYNLLPEEKSTNEAERLQALLQSLKDLYCSCRSPSKRQTNEQIQIEEKCVSVLGFSREDLHQLSHQQLLAIMNQNRGERGELHREEYKRSEQYLRHSMELLLDRYKQHIRNARSKKQEPINPFFEGIDVENYKAKLDAASLKTLRELQRLVPPPQKKIT